jgi:hypothetical protein
MLQGAAHLPISSRQTILVYSNHGTFVLAQSAEQNRSNLFIYKNLSQKNGALTWPSIPVQPSTTRPPKNFLQLMVDKN